MDRHHTELYPRATLRVEFSPVEGFTNDRLDCDKVAVLILVVGQEQVEVGAALVLVEQAFVDPVKGD